MGSKLTTVPASNRVRDHRMPTTNPMRRHSAIACVAGAALILFSACAGHYNARYFDHGSVPEAQKLEGKALIITTPEADKYEFTGRPTGFTGAATFAEIPVGEVIKEAALKAFGETFSGGAKASHSLEDSPGYRLVLQPELVSFSYSYSMNPFSMVSIPKVRVSMRVKAVGAANSTPWEKVYVPDDIAGNSILGGIGMAERVSEATHWAILQIMREAANDIRLEVFEKWASSSTP